ncbi:hypothetical protein BraRD5C2_67920 [Bradyrhizobium sp. RD5-C2]|nr:hypothetical protein BraRD5C2_67920 [Bradyrhizobium sp. RD5-C2]
MAPKQHSTPLSGRRSQGIDQGVGAGPGAVTTILAARSAEKRAAGEDLIREADDLLCQSWNERMWADGGPVDPSPSIDQAINADYPWLEIKCSRCKTPRAVDLAALPHVATAYVHDLAGRLRCQKCRKAGKRPAAELLQLWQRSPIGDGT